MRQNRLKMRRHPVAFGKAAFAVRMPAKRPEVGTVINVEGDLAPELPCQFHRGKAGAGHTVGTEMCSRHENSLGRGDEIRIDILFPNRHVGAVLAIKDQRELLAVANAKNDERRQPFRIGEDITCVDALAVQRFEDEPAHMFVTDAGDQRRSQAKPGASDADIGRAATDIFGKARHIFETTADLATIKVDRRTTDADDIQGRINHARGPFCVSGRSRWQDTGPDSWSRRASGTRTGSLR